MKEISLIGPRAREFGLVALVDDEDYHYLSSWRWYHNPTGQGQGYAMSCAEESGTVYMHREIMQAPFGMEVDHIRANSELDNRKSNLRLLDHASNIRNRPIQSNNTSGYRGVTWDKRRNMWKSQIKVRGVHYNIGMYDTPEDAFLAYEAMRRRMGLLASSKYSEREMAAIASASPANLVDLAIS